MAVRVFADFSGGEAGAFDLGKVPANFWTGRNMILYRSGILGPRPGLKAHALGRVPVGPINGLGFIEAGARSLLYVDGTGVWVDNPDGAAALQIGTITAPSPRWPIRIYDVTNETGFMHVPNGGRSFRLRPSNGVIEDMNTSGGVAGCIYGLRAVRSDSSNNRFYYSATNTAFSWPSANFTDIRIANRIVFMTEQRGHLTIVTADGTWWVLQGVPGVNDTLRRITGGRTVPAAMAPESFVDIGDDLVHYLSPINNYPGSFNGEEHTELSYLSMTPENPRASYASGTQTDAYNRAKAFQGADNSSPAFVIPAGHAGPNGRLLLKHNGVWGLHEFETPMSQFWSSNGRGRIFGFGSGPDANTSLFTAQLRLDRPAFTSDTNARPGDNSNTPLDCHITFPETWSESGDEILVKEVMVDFVRWNTGVAEPNRIRADITALARGSEGEPLTETREWTQAGSSSPAAQEGTKDRVRFGFGPQGSGAAWRLKLHGLRGVAIRQVAVIYEPVAGNARLW